MKLMDDIKADIRSFFEWLDLLWNLFLLLILCILGLWGIWNMCLWLGSVANHLSGQ